MGRGPAAGTVGCTEQVLGMYSADNLKYLIFRDFLEWSEREDLNLRPPVPQTGALTRLRYAPIEMPLLHGSAAGVNHQSGHKSRLS